MAGTTTSTETVTQAVLRILPTPDGTGTTQEVASSELQKQVSWVDGTLDNEQLGRKSSKVCCIYHKPRAFAESSSESSSSSGESDGEGAQRNGKDKKTKKCKHQEHYKAEKCCSSPSKPQNPSAER